MAGQKNLLVALLLAGLIGSISLNVAGSENFSSWGRVIYSRETPYQYLRVTEDATGERHLLLNQGLGSQSSFHPGRILTGKVYDYFSLLPYLFQKQKTVKVLLLGVAGGTVLRQLNYFFPESAELTAVEIDEQAVAAAKRFFGLDGVKAKIFIADGRRYLKQTDATYDIILVDVYVNDLEIPWHMTTSEFWRETARHLDPGGIVAFNVVGSNSPGGLPAVIGNTLATVFSTVQSAALSDSPVGNYLFLACDCEALEAPMAVDAVPSLLRPHWALLQARVSRSRFNPAVTVLTDDRAPVELLTARTFLGAAN
ncbi:MAG: fused MFS/spermidine synthase [Patescibacteria group bacterium]|nr:fused MFS/spermidine synthase [Patescibacteria group bacterium]